MILIQAIKMASLDFFPTSAANRNCSIVPVLTTRVSRYRHGCCTPLTSFPSSTEASLRRCLFFLKIVTAVFLALNVSSIFVHASPSPSDSGVEDHFNFSSLMSRGDERVLALAGDFPDDIIPVDVKDEGNENDPDTGLGMVIQEYSIAQTEVTANQYCNYLNEVATGDNYQLFYNEKMGSDPNVASIKRVVVNGKNQYSVIQDQQGDRGHFPIVYVSLYQAARFCNWLQNHNTPGLTGDDLTERGAYTLNGKSSGPIARNPGAVWFIPNESEWYKAAYYKGGGLRQGYWQFANRSDWAPSHSLQESANAANYCSLGYTKKQAPCLTGVTYFKNSLGSYNTYDMSGNVAEWVETEEKQGAMPLKYIARGGSWKSSYYGSTVASKLEVADWGIELSKWSRPSYDPAEGYDNVGFRVATSLIVNSAPPATPAPGAAELSPTETIEAPFIILGGLGIIFSGKNFYAYRRESEERRNKIARKIDEQREKQGAGMGSDLRDPSATAQIAEDLIKKTDKEESKPEESFSILSPEKASITEQEKEEIEEAIARISTLFKDAVEKYQDYKKFLQEKGEEHPEGLKKIEEMCHAYDDYTAAVVAAAKRMEEQFSEEHDLWIPWYTASMKALSEAMLLRHAAIKPYYRICGISHQPADLEGKIFNLRHDSNQKTLAYIQAMRDYQNNLSSISKDAENLSQNDAVAEALNKTVAEMTSLEKIESEINQNEKAISKTFLVGSFKVNEAYSEYEKAQGVQNDNLYALFILTDKTQRNIINFVDSLQLSQQFQEFLLSKAQISQRILSPGGLVPSSELHFQTPVRNNLGLSGSWFMVPHQKLLPEGTSIEGKIVPITLDHKLRELELKEQQQRLQTTSLNQKSTNEFTKDK